MGQGPAPAKIMVIGEAPGHREDNLNKPFQGKSGKLLDSHLNRIGIKREDIFITNVVKCRPPENRKPSSKEIKACREYLEKELEAVHPKYVLLLGATALKAFTRKAKITMLRGSKMELEDDPRIYMPAFHPSAILHDPGKAKALEQDMNAFKRMVDGTLETRHEIDWKFITKKNFNEFKAELMVSEEFGYDIETSRLDPFFPDSKIWLISFALPNGRTWLLPLECEYGELEGDREGQRGFLTEILEIIEENNIKGIAQNGKFEGIWTEELFGLRFPLNFDTMLAHHTLDENSPHDVEFLARIYLGVPAYDIELRLKQGQFENKAEFLKACEYNAKDSHYTLGIKQIFMAELRRDPILRRLFYRLVMRAARAYVDFESEGFFLNLKHREELRKNLYSEKARLLKKLNDLAGRELNWNSPQQVSKLLFEDLKLTPFKKTDGGNLSTDEESMKELKDDHPICSTLLEYREVEKNRSTYVDGLDELMVGAKCYISTKIHGTVTGRYANRMHSIPRNSIIRSQFDAEEGWVFFQADYSQIELRIAAVLSGCKRMLMIFQTGGDIHRATASEVTGIPEEDVTKEDRKKAKAINFGFIYGMGYKKFRMYAKEKYDAIFSDSESKRYRRRYFEFFDGLLQWHERQRRILNDQGYVEYLSGRRRRLPGVYSDEDDVKAEAERQGINSPVQGFGSGDLKAMAMVEIHDKLDRRFLKILGEQHDSILGKVRKDKLHLLQDVRDIMEHPELLTEFGIKLNVPIVVDIETGPWGAGKPYPRREHASH